MPSLVGRRVTFTPTGSGVALTGVRTTSLTIGNEPIDITSNDDNGYRTLLAEDPAMRMLDISVEGITKDAALIALAAAGGSGLLSGYELDLQAFGAFTGDFYIGNLELGMPYNEAITFSCTIQSSGPYTYTPAS
jgi:predicted secreted protein